MSALRIGFKERVHNRKLFISAQETMGEQKEGLLFGVGRQKFWSRTIPKPEMRY